MSNAAASEFVIRCFHARTNAHVLHLSTRSFSVHKALNEFYDELIPLVDAFAEAYQGEYGLLTGVTGRYAPTDDPVQLVDQLTNWIDDNVDSFCDDMDSTYLKNIVDEVLALCRSTTYKLKFLK